MMSFELPLGVSSADALASAALVSILLIGWWITGRISIAIGSFVFSQCGLAKA